MYILCFIFVDTAFLLCGADVQTDKGSVVDPCVFSLLVSAEYDIDTKQKVEAIEVP